MTRRPPRGLCRRSGRVTSRRSIGGSAAPRHRPAERSGKSVLQFEKCAGRLNFAGQSNIELVVVDDAAGRQARCAGQIHEMQAVVFAQGERRDEQLRHRGRAAARAPSANPEHVVTSAYGRESYRQDRSQMPGRGRQSERAQPDGCTQASAFRRHDVNAVVRDAHAG